MPLIHQFPRDEALPQMTTLMNVAAMREIFQRRLFVAPNAQVAACEIDRIKHKAGANCMVSYRLSLFDQATQLRDEQILCARIYQAGESLARFHKAQLQPIAATQLAPPLLHVPELEMVVWTFPNDRKLDGLPKIVDRDFLQHALFPDAVAKHFGRSWSVADLACKLVHYVPEHTCTVRVDMNLHHNAPMALFGKTYYNNNEGEQAFQNMHRLWKSQARASGELNMAQPFCYHPETKSLWQFGLSGKTLMEYDVRSADFLALLPRAAANVAALHQTPIANLRRVGRSDLRGKLEEMKILLSKHQHCVEALMARLIAYSKNFADPPMATLHGHLHLKNFFVGEGKVALIDMDNLCQGAPLQDIGSFIAGLWYRGMLMEIPPADIYKRAEVFTQAYKERTPWHVLQAELDWHTAAALINERAFRCLTRLKAGRLDILDRLLALADKISADLK
jgi:hypothetical protein